VVLAILPGAELLGVWGAILALPVAVATQMVLLELLGRRTSEAA
jgi:predicted PurR-regulated permease PerM